MLYPKDVEYRRADRIYWSILQLATDLEEHSFSRSIPKRDADAIYKVIATLREIGNNLYLASHTESSDSTGEV